MPKSVEITCKLCGKSFYVWPCQASGARFCSKECNGRYLVRDSLKRELPCQEAFFGRKKP